MSLCQTACRKGQDAAMDVSDAIHTAKDYVNAVFKDDGIAMLGLKRSSTISQIMHGRSRSASCARAATHPIRLRSCWIAPQPIVSIKW
jgi:hypothetical protein